ncbi:UNVERIFIED_CONTAM: hypothetical protein RMT77_015447 [Armadillidium vulgare]
MGFTRQLLYLSVLVVLGGLLLNKYSPRYTATLIEKYPPIKDAINIIKKYSSLIYPIGVKRSTGKPGEFIFTPDELKEFAGREGDEGLYLAFLGIVYDVEKGRKYYGPNNSYSFFAGRDATRAFVTGDFTEKGLIDDVSDLTPEEYLGILEWDKLYKRDYKSVGKVIGKYYDENGNITPFRKEVEKLFEEAKGQKALEDEEKIQFPPCNSEFNMDIGSKVYCTSASGGIERSWVGVPRKFFILGSKRERCACVKNFGKSAIDLQDGEVESDTETGRGDLDNPNVREYDNCEPDEDFCYLKKFNKT